MKPRASQPISQVLPPDDPGFPFLRRRLLVWSADNGRYPADAGKVTDRHRSTNCLSGARCSISARLRLNRERAGSTDSDVVDVPSERLAVVVDDNPAVAPES